MDDDSFAHLYSASYPPLVAQLTLLTGSRATAEDLAQEAFARAWSRRRVLAQYDDPAAWVRRVAYNLAVSQFRSMRRAIRLRARTVAVNDGGEPSPDWLDLRASLLKLPKRQRQALVLAAVVGLKNDEIAAEMGVSANTVRSWLHRSRQAGRPDDEREFDDADRR